MTPSFLPSDSLKNNLPSTLTLTQTNSIQLTRWWQPSWILASWIQPCYTKLWLQLIQSDSNSFVLTELDDGSHLEFAILDLAIYTKKTLLMHSHSNWWWQPSWILKSWIQPFCTKKTSLIHSDLTWWWQPSNTSLNHSDSTWWWQPSWILPTSIQPFSTKKNFTHSFWLNLMMAAILNSAILDSDDAILDSNTLSSSLRFLQKHSDITLTLTQTNSIWLKLIQYESNSFILTQLDDGSHLEFCQLLFCHFAQKELHSFILTQLQLSNSFGFRHCHLDSNLPSSLRSDITLTMTQTICTNENFNMNQTHSFWLNLMMAAILNSAMLDSDTAILDSDTLFSSLRFLQKHSDITLTLIQQIQSDSNSFILT